LTEGLLFLISGVGACLSDLFAKKAEEILCLFIMFLSYKTLKMAVLMDYLKIYI
jgi:hypothetical protein